VRRDLVIFDCDGVLVDSELLSVRADRLTARGAAAVVDDMARLLRALRSWCIRIGFGADGVCVLAPSIVPPNAGSG
jgi:beta-phosphoglucomutase-like phosphatase (HAD superfamily)